MNTQNTKTPGQILFESMAMPTICTWHSCTIKYQEHLEAAALAVLASQWRPVTEPPEGELQRVLLCGGDVARIDQFNRKAVARTHWMPIPPLTPEPIDPYAEFEKARSKRKVPLENLRIKPWTLPCHLPGFRALEPGEEWHRNDFTEDMLPEGWRPLMEGERFQPTDSILVSEEWVMATSFFIGGIPTWPTAKAYTRNGRTRRHLPPTREELERKEFEEWSFNAGYGCSSQQIRDTLFVAWQAARKQKESK